MAGLAGALVLTLLFVQVVAAQRLCPGEFCRPVAEPIGACFHIAASYGGDTKEEAVEKAQTALDETIRTWRRRHGWGGVGIRVTPLAPAPQPFVRATVSPHLMLEPDVVSGHAHTVCWRGVVLPAVCTAGARVCRAGG